jgi:hypothetical protein
VDSRPKTNAVILWDMGHTKGRLCKGGKIFSLRLMCSLYRNEYRNLKLMEATTGRGPGRREEDWKRGSNWNCNAHMHGINTRKLPV